MATSLGVDESSVWPDALGRDEVTAALQSEVVAVYVVRNQTIQQGGGRGLEPRLRVAA